MYEYEPLEQKWKKYRLHRLIKLLIISFFAIFIIVYISISILNRDIEKTNIEISKQLEEQKKEPSSLQNTTIQEQVLVVPKYTPQPLPNVKENIEKPIIEEQIKPSSEEVKDKTIDKKIEQKDNSVDSKQLFLNNAEEIEEEIISLQNENHQKEIAKPKGTIEIKQNSVVNIKELRDKYYATNDIKFAYTLMREYYNQKDYQKSMFWTMKINEAEPDNEESWLFFAKNSAKLGKKDDAVNALNQYIEAFKSIKAKELLDEIQKGKLD